MTLRDAVEQALNARYGLPSWDVTQHATKAALWVESGDLGWMLTTMELEALRIRHGHAPDRLGQAIAALIRRRYNPDDRKETQ